MLLLGVRVRDVAVREMERRAERDPVVRTERERGRHTAERGTRRLPADAATRRRRAAQARSGRSGSGTARRCPRRARRATSATAARPRQSSAKPAIASAPAASCSKNVGASGAAIVATPKSAAVDRAGARTRALAEPPDDEHGDEEEHARGEDAHQPQRASRPPPSSRRRLRDTERTLELECRHGEERHARRLVRVRAAVVHRPVEERRARPGSSRGERGAGSGRSASRSCGPVRLIGGSAASATSASTSGSNR